MYEWQAEVRYGDEGSIVAVWHYHHYSLTGCYIKLLQCQYKTLQLCNENNILIYSKILSVYLMAY